jgi:hypothetical protein
MEYWKTGIVAIERGKNGRIVFSHQSIIPIGGKTPEFLYDQQITNILAIKVREIQVSLHGLIGVFVLE